MLLTFIVYYNACQKEIYFIFDKHFHNSISLCERQQSKGCCFSVYPVKMNTIEKNQRRYSQKRNIPFDLFILYTFKTSYRWDLSFFHSIFLWKMVIRNTFALLISSSCVCSANFPYHPSASIQINLSVCILLIFPIFLSFWSSPQTISNSQLHVLPHFHLCPIYLVVFKGSY